MVFAPIHWGAENSRDADLGSMGPILLPNGWIYADGKAGQGYLLKANHLGGVGGQTATISLCISLRGRRGSWLAGLYSLHHRFYTKITITSGGHITAGWHAPATLQGSPIIGGHTYL